MLTQEKRLSGFNVFLCLAMPTAQKENPKGKLHVFRFAFSSPWSTGVIKADSSIAWKQVVNNIIRLSKMFGLKTPRKMRWNLKLDFMGLARLLQEIAAASSFFLPPRSCLAVGHGGVSTNGATLVQKFMALRLPCTLQCCPNDGLPVQPYQVI